MTFIALGILIAGAIASYYAWSIRGTSSFLGSAAYNILSNLGALALIGGFVLFFMSVKYG